MSTPTFQRPHTWVTSTEDFLRSLLVTRGCHWSGDTDGRFSIEFPGDASEDWFQQSKEARCFLASAGSDDEDGERVAADIDSPLFSWLTRDAALPQSVGDALASEPRGGVHELAQRLFAAYEVEPGVTMQLGGCGFEARAILCLTYLHRPVETAPGESETPQLLRAFWSADGEQFDSELVEDLGLLDWSAPNWRHARMRYPAGQWQQTLERANEHFQANQASDDGSFELRSATRVWSTYTEGRINFLAGDVTASVPFSGWAAPLLRGQTLPPPFRCKSTGTMSYHVGVTDDQKITTADGIATCSVSNQRVLASELAVCERTDKQVHESLLATCPVTGKRLLKQERATCQSCRQAVWPDCLRGGRCSACRQLQAVEKSDPRLARILGEYPKFDEWPKWWISETQTAYILVARSWIRRHLIVLDKDTLAPLHEASGSRFSRSWRPAE